MLALGDALGLKNYGANLVRLEPGAWWSQRHWHTLDDDFTYVLQGRLSLTTDEGEQVLVAGMAAGFSAGAANGHHLANKSDSIVGYLEVGDRDENDAVHYPDIDLLYSPGASGRGGFTRKNGDLIGN